MSVERRTESPRRRLDRLIVQIDGSPQSLLFQGAKEREIVLIEQRIGYRLPSLYRRFLAHTDGAQLFQTEEFFGTSDDSSDNASRQSVLTARGKMANLPQHLIPFHQNASSVHCFDASEARPGRYKEYPIAKWDVTNGVAVRVKSSFTEFLEGIVGQYG